MKIGIDLRFIEDNIFSRFVLSLVNALSEKRNERDFMIYLNDKNLPITQRNNVKTQLVEIPNGSFAEQTKFKKILHKDKNHLMLFFTPYKPIFYTKDYISFVGSLKDIYYSNFKSGFEKHKYLFLAEKNFKKSKALICLDTKTKNELIERFNIHEQKIYDIKGFFPIHQEYDYNSKESIIDLKTKYAIKHPFFIYSAGNSIEKNYEKLISVFHKLQISGLKLDLVFLGNNISKNINLRNQILEKNMQQNVFFLGSPELDEKKLLYKESLGVIFPSFYEPFPFRLTEPLYFNTNILSSNLEKVKAIFGKTISYFSPISENSILEAMKKYLKEQHYKTSPDYSDIKASYNLENTLNEILEIIDKH